MTAPVPLSKKQNLRALDLVADVGAGSLQLFAKLRWQRELNVFFGGLHGSDIAVTTFGKLNKNSIDEFFRNRSAR